MELIFHEKQEGNLCGVHCLNNLLQSKYFSEFDLAQIAAQVDQQELERMSEGADSEEYRKLLNNPKSRNMDDSGFFSIEVILKALKIFNLEVVNYNSSNQIAFKARECPTTQNAYICNFKEHWFTIRKLGKQYFNLNSLLSTPELLSSSYLHLFLTQLQQECYSIFIVVGSLPTCQADEIGYSTKLVTQANKPQIISNDGLKMKIKNPFASHSAASFDSNKEIEDNCIQKAIEESLLQSNQDSEIELQAAISLSMQEIPTTSKDKSSFNSMDELTDEQLLEKAILMSLDKN